MGAGPKNYSYETTDGELHTKVKGFTLDYQTTHGEGEKTGINHRSIEKMVDSRVEGEICGPDLKIPVTYNMITRDKKEKKITTKSVVKRYGFVYEKRAIQLPDRYGNVDTLPFGY